MKHLKLVLLLPLFLLLFNCSEDEDKMLQPEPDVIEHPLGIWNLEQVNNEDVSDCLKNSTVEILETQQVNITMYDTNCSYTTTNGIIEFISGADYVINTTTSIELNYNKEDKTLRLNNGSSTTYWIKK